MDQVPVGSASLFVTGVLPIGETTIRLGSSSLRSEKGDNSIASGMAVPIGQSSIGSGLREYSQIQPRFPVTSNVGFDAGLFGHLRPFRELRLDMSFELLRRAADDDRALGQNAFPDVGSASVATISLCSRLIISLGVPPVATMPCHSTASNPLTVSPSAGTLGNAGMRWLLLTARGISLPA
jgi:hypothetical protein